MDSSLLNLRENKGISTTKSRGKTTAKAVRNCKLSNIVIWLESIRGIAAIKIANAGVGNPINEVVCLASILKFAKRTAENIGISKANISGKKNPSKVALLNRVL